MPQKLSPEAYANKIKYNSKYAKNNFKTKLIQFNINYPEDIALLNWVNSRGEGGNAYIKRLIREDMAKAIINEADELP